MRTCVGAGLILSASVTTASAAGLSPPPIDQLPAPIYRWSGGTGNWSDPARWWPQDVPGKQPHANPAMVLVDRGNPAASAVYVDVNAVIAGLGVDANDALIFDPGTILTLQGGGTFDNSGLVHLPGGPSPTRLVLAGDQDIQFGGGGRLVLAGHGAVVEGLVGTERLVNLDHTIQGFGVVGDKRLGIVNHGEVIADVQFESLTVNTGPNGLRNLGVMGSTSGGWLRLIDTHVDNEGGVIAADHGSFVELDGSTIERGLLATSGSGVIRNMDAATLWRDVVNNGRYMLGPTELWLEGSIRNNGVIDIVGDLTHAALEPASTVRVLPHESSVVSLMGTGTMTLLSCEIVAGGPAQPAQLVHGEEHTIRGEGFVGAGDLAVVNGGTIIADGTSLLRFNPGVGRSLVNEGTLRAVGPAGAAIVSGCFLNNGLVDVREGSRLLMFPGAIAENNAGGILVGGTWRIEGHHAPATLALNGANILVNAAHVSLIGPVSFFPRLDSISSNNGVLRLLEGRHFNTMGYFHNWGELVVDTASGLQVSGAFKNKSAATLEVRLSGLPSPCGLICAGGVASLGGTLRIVADTTLPPGTVVNLIVATGGRSGTFASIQSPPDITVAYTATGVTATIAASAP